MSVSLTDVINNAGYDPAHNVEDAQWLFAQYNDYDDLANQAQELLDQYDNYLDCKENAEDDGDCNYPSFEEWRKYEAQK